MSESRQLEHPEDLNESACAECGWIYPYLVPEGDMDAGMIGVIATWLHMAVVHCDDKTDFLTEGNAIFGAQAETLRELAIFFQGALFAMTGSHGLAVWCELTGAQLDEVARYMKASEN